jgi:hypothetical protein
MLATETRDECNNPPRALDLARKFSRYHVRVQRTIHNRTFSFLCPRFYVLGERECES